MKKNTLFFAVLFICTAMFGQSKSLSNLYTLDFGVSILKGVESNTLSNGYNFHFAYDYFNANNSLSRGFSIGYMEVVDENAENEIAYTTMPILLQGKYFPTSGRYLYLQGGAGIHFSQAEHIGTNRFIIASGGGVILLAGAGSLFTLDENLLLKVAYSFNWLDGKTYQNGIIHSLNIGLAFH